MPTREAVTVHVGQAGCQLGMSLWELLCCEHGILPSGERPGDEEDDLGNMNDPFNSFFNETAAGKHVPRSVFIDTDPATRENVLTSAYGQLYHPDAVLGYKQDSKGLFTQALMDSKTFQVCESVMDRVRRTVDLCDNLQGFFLMRSHGGGTGAGLGNLVLQALKEQYGRKVIFEPAICPSKDYASSTVEPYNALFALAESQQDADLSIMLDNQAAYRMCRQNLKLQNPTFDNLNAIISQMVSACTGSMRYESEINASMAEMVTNLVPMSPFRYTLLSMSPVRHADHAKHENFSVREIVSDLFEEKNVLCDCGGKLLQNRFMSTAILLRGTDRRAARAFEAVDGLPAGDPPIQVSEAKRAIQNMIAPPREMAYREPLKFCPWLLKGGFKVGIVAEPPRVPSNVARVMAESDRQGSLLCNTTAVRSLFMRNYEKYKRLMFKRAYLWQFLDSGGDQETFVECEEVVRGMIDEYEKLLSEAQQQEAEDGAEGETVELVGGMGVAAAA